MIFENFSESGEQKNPFLIKVVKCEKINDDGTADFLLYDKSIVTKKYISIADCSYDTVFKSIFYSQINTLNNTDGNKRLISFLNALFFPNSNKENDFKIKKVEIIKNEIVHFNEKFNKGTIKFDVPCKCFCWSSNEEKHVVFGVDVEMQIKYKDNFATRFYRYNSALNESYEFPYILISLLNYKEINTLNIDDTDTKNKEGDCSINRKDDNKKFKRWIGVGPSIFDRDNNTYELLDELYYNTYFFDLKSEQENFLINKNIKLNKNEISLEAIAWLKIFSIRQWSKRDPIFNTDRFVIPDDFNGLSDEIKDAINILKCYNHRDLLMAMEDQRHLLEVIMEEKEKSEKIGLEKGEEIGFGKGKEIGFGEGKEIGIGEGKEIGFGEGERKSNLNAILTVLKSGVDLKKFGSITERFSKKELKIIKDFEENPYDIKTFSEKIKVNEENILDICENLGIEIGKKRKLK